MNDSAADVGAVIVERMTAAGDRVAVRAALAVWLAATVSWCARWPLFPLVLDPYYHLLVAREVAAAGGPIAFEPWQYAPVGRWHLYPPVLHTILASLLQLGLSPVVMMRLVSAAIVPLLLGCAYAALRRIAGPWAALAGLCMAMVPFGFHLHSAIVWAASLALIQLLWLLVALHDRRPLAVTALTALLFYTHLGTPWVAMGVVAAAALSTRDLRPVGWALVGMLLSAPWLWHVASHLAWLRPMGRAENDVLELYPAVWLLAGLGAWWAWRDRRGACRLLLGWILSSTMMAARFPYRWLCGEGLLPWLLLAGLGLDGAAERMSRPRGGSAAARLLAMTSLLVIAVALPSVRLASGRAHLAWRSAAPWQWFAPSDAPRNELDAGLVAPQTVSLAKLVEDSTQPGEVLWSNAPYAVGLIAALANRPMSSAMFSEVQPLESFDPIAAARLIVWFKLGPMPGTPPLERVVRRYGLLPVADTDIAWVLQSPQPRPRASPPRAVVPLWAAVMLLCGFLGLIGWDLMRQPALPLAASRMPGAPARAAETQRS